MARPVRKRVFQSGALQHTYDQFIAKDADAVQLYEEDLVNAEVARMVYELRTKAGLSQRDLAKRVGTSASAICRLEDADDDGHSLYLLKRIAQALDRRVEIRFMPLRRKPLQPA